MLIKGQCHEIFDFWFFSWISFPQSPIRAVHIFSKIRGDIRSSRCTTGFVLVNGKIFKQKMFNYFVWTPLGSIVNIYINFCFQVHFKISAAWYCSHYLCCCRCLVLLTPAANLPPVSTTPTVSVAKFAAGVVDTSGKFATGVVDTVGAPWAALLSFWLFLSIWQSNKRRYFPIGQAILYIYSILFWPFWVISASVVNPLLCFLKEIRDKYQIVTTNLFHRYAFGGSAYCAPHVITLLLTNTASPGLACLIIWFERFRGGQKEDERGLLSIQFSLGGV